MLGHIFETQRSAVFGEAKQRGEKSGIQVDVIADFDVQPGWCCGTVDYVLYGEVLGNFRFRIVGVMVDGKEQGYERRVGRGRDVWRLDGRRMLG